MRHSRSDQFDAAWHHQSKPHWGDVTTDPNDPAALAHRARTLAAAWMPDISDRIEFLRSRCAGKSVLDIGCVAHAEERLDAPDWLHRHIVDAAASCVGVDILETGIEAMRAAGYDAVAHDLSTGLGPLGSRGPFDVIVAGELIEHVTDLDFLFEIAREALAPGGELLLTTPNPYAPARVHAGQRGIVWENADHVTYVFPAGMAELAERNDLQLTGAATIVDPDRPPLDPIGRIKRAIRGTGYRAVGYDTTGRPGKQVRLRAGSLLARLVPNRRPRFLGETFVYVVTNPQTRSSSDSTTAG